MRGVLVAGGGLAGAAAAAALAQAGVDVTVVEREGTPVDKICGEFLSAEAEEYLARLGVDTASLGGHPITRVLLIRGRKLAAARLPFRGVGISRRALDEALLSRAAACGANVRRGHHIQSFVKDREIVIKASGIEDIRPKTLFLATGKHDLRGLRRDAPPPAAMVGFKMYFRLAAPLRDELAGHVALIMYRGGYAGLQLVENGQANLCLLVSRARLADVGGTFSGLLEALRVETPYLARILAGASPGLDQPLSIYRVPYGFIHNATAADPPGVFRLGDQVAVIPSFTGDGMSIALHSAAVAVACYLRGETAASYHRRLAGEISGQIFRAGMLYKFAMAAPTQTAFFGVARMFPKCLALAASLTRVPPTVRPARRGSA